MTAGPAGEGPGARPGAPPDGVERRRAHRTTASDRFRRLVTVVPWIAAHDGPRISEVCDRFGLTRKQLLDDLQVIPLVGLPPYTPDTLIDVTIEGDRVWLRFADVFARPPKLTPEQGLALVAAGAAWRQLPGVDAEGPLATALDKVAAVLDIDPGEAVSVALRPSRPETLDTLRRAVAERRRARLDYYAYGRDQRAVRDVDPYAVFWGEGSWYVRGYCHRAEGARIFRLDRIYEAELLDVTFPEPDDDGAGDEGDDEVFTPGPDVGRVTLDLAPAARWVVEHFPVEDVEERPDGSLQARLAVTARPWLERLLLRLGPDGQVVASDDAALSDAGPAAAQRILARYER